MKLKCIKCGKYLGEIRDANLRKNITHLCKECTAILIKPKQKKEEVNDFFNEFFKDMFKGF